MHRDRVQGALTFRRCHPDGLGKQFAVTNHSQPPGLLGYEGIAIGKKSEAPGVSEPIGNGYDPDLTTLNVEDLRFLSLRARRQAD